MKRVLIANRGEIAHRIIQTCRRLGYESVAVYSKVDSSALHVAASDQACALETDLGTETYMDGDRLIDIALQQGVDAIHPGYGFLSENADFARAVQAAGLLWVGPSADSMALMANKIDARRIAEKEDIPVVPALTLAAREQYQPGSLQICPETPILIKASAGGGGIGMREVRDEAELAPAIDAAKIQAQRLFGVGDLILERLVENGRHVEVQIVGDKQGKLLHLLDRDCSAQRRRQKLLEEAPAPDLEPAVRTALHKAALRLAESVNYHGVGTVEFLVDGTNFYFLEMNTRLQVEHPVTESILGLDLVELQLDIACDKPLRLSQADIQPRGHAIEARLYAEAPAQNFLPQAGYLSAFDIFGSDDVRVDSGVSSGQEISQYYDPLLCKISAHGENRAEATAKLATALTNTRIAGISTNQAFLRGILTSKHWSTILSTSTVETELSTFLELSLPDTEALRQFLTVATIWQFKANPPPADQVFWPGAAHIPRQTHWRTSGQDHRVNWLWGAHNSYRFPEWGTAVKVLEDDRDTNTIVLEIQGQRDSFTLCAEENRLWLWSRNLGNLDLTLCPASERDQQTEFNGQCRSPGPGTVVAVLTEPAATVRYGDPLLIIESMKMESALTAPADGIVAAIAVAEGELITSDQLLITLTSSTEVNT